MKIIFLPKNNDEGNQIKRKGKNEILEFILREMIIIYKNLIAYSIFFDFYFTFRF